MASQHIRTTVGHLKGGNMATAVSVLEHKDIFANPKFRYTVDCNKNLLNSEQRQFYEDNGFIVVKNLVPKEDLDRYSARFEDIAHRRVHVPGMTMMKDVAVKDRDTSQYVVNKLQDLFLDEELFAYCRAPQILDYVENFVGPNQMAMDALFVNKAPGSGSMTCRHPLHQHLDYFPFRPGDRIVCSWTAMQRVTRENGCLVAIPGSHRGALLEHDYPEWEGGVSKGYHGIKGAEGLFDKLVFLEVDAGDTLFFHPLLIHGSGANKTQGFRKAITCHYAASDCEFIDVAGTSQEYIVQEVLEIAKRTGFPIKNYRDAWRFRAQLVRGVQISL